MTTMEDRTRTLTADEVDAFGERLLDALYALSPYVRNGLMPVSLREKPASFEKYPQMLFTMLEVNCDPAHTDGAVREALATWRSQVLRKLDYLEVSEQAYQTLQQLEQWMVLHNAGLCNKSTLRHLRKSMFGRTYTYLYPRLSLIMEYAQTCRREGWLDESAEGGRRLRAVGDVVFLREHFADATPETQVRIEETLGEEQVGRLLQSAQKFLVQQQAYFDAVFRSKREENR